MFFRDFVTVDLVVFMHTFFKQLDPLSFILSRNIFIRFPHLSYLLLKHDLTASILFPHLCLSAFIEIITTTGIRIILLNCCVCKKCLCLWSQINQTKDSRFKFRIFFPFLLLQLFFIFSSQSFLMEGTFLFPFKHVRTSGNSMFLIRIFIIVINHCSLLLQCNPQHLFNFNFRFHQ